MNPLSLFDKLWRLHVIAELDAQFSLLHIDRIFLHERTGGVALQSITQDRRTVRHPELVFCTMDHIVDTFESRGDDTLVPGGKGFIQTTRMEARRAGIRLFDIRDTDHGIVHVISPEQGIALPGATIVCPDSHTCTQGGIGALAWGIGSSEAEHALATQTLRVSKPKSMRVQVHNTLRAPVGAKDLMLFLIARHSAAGGSGHAIEFAGPAIRGLSVEARLTLCNMAVEFAAFTGLVEPDDRVFEYLHGRPFAPTGRMWDRALDHWRRLPSDPDAQYHSELTLDAAEIPPMITWGTSPEHAIPVDGVVPDSSTGATANTRAGRERAMAYMDLRPHQTLRSLPIDAAFIGSCTNARLSDLESAAAILRGRKVAPGVRAICVPGSMQVRRDAEARGLHRIFLDAGFEWRVSGCSMCFNAGGESFGTEQRVVSTTNRNFESRQGPRTRTHLASPATVAACAIAGHIADPRQLTLAD